VTAGTYHAGLVMPVAELIAAAEKTRHGEVIGIATRFAAYPYVEIGWGDEGFYRLVPTLAALTAAEALRALFRPGNPSVLHVVGLDRQPGGSLPGLRLVPIRLSEEGFERLVSRLSESVATQDCAPGRARRRALRAEACSIGRAASSASSTSANHWVARLLDAAGVPTTPVLDTLPFGLVLDLGGGLGSARRRGTSATFSRGKG